jgi:hypothetical protein
MCACTNALEIMVNRVVITRVQNWNTKTYQLILNKIDKVQRNYSINLDDCREK